MYFPTALTAEARRHRLREQGCNAALGARVNGEVFLMARRIPGLALLTIPIDRRPQR